MGLLARGQDDGAKRLHRLRPALLQTGTLQSGDSMTLNAGNRVRSRWRKSTGNVIRAGNANPLF